MKIISAVRQYRNEKERRYGIGFVLRGKVSIVLFPLTCALVMSVLVGVSVVRTTSPYIVPVLIGLILVVVAWSVFFIHDQYRLYTGLTNRGADCPMAFLFSAVMISVFFAYATWDTGYLSLDPIGKINSGLQHPDNLYQSAIAESYNRSIFPVALVNQEAVLHYHTLSCLIANILSRIFQMPSFFIYSYLYPIFILPLYGFIQYYGILVAKQYFIGTDILTFSDAVLVILYNVGLFGTSIMSHFCIWKSSYVNSESFVTANTVAILFFCFCFKMMKTEKFKRIFLYLVIPITIFVLSGMKISVGCLVTAAVIYYFLRTEWKNYRYWILNLYYLTVLAGAFFLFKGGSGGNGGNSKAGIELFSFILRYCDGRIDRACGHYLILSLMTIIFIWTDIKKKKYKVTDIQSGKSVWVELAAMITICSFLPEIFLNIKGASAVYFSFFAGIPSMLLLCGHGYPEALFGKISSFFRTAVFIILIVWVSYISRNNFDVFCFDRWNEALHTDENIYEAAMEIRTLVSNTSDDFTIYLDKDAQVLKTYSNLPIAGIYIYPALSGVGIINASYRDDNLCYTVSEVPITGYGMGYVDHQKLSLDEAVQYARELGKTKLIHMKKNGYEVIDLR